MLQRIIVFGALLATACGATSTGSDTPAVDGGIDYDALFADKDAFPCGPPHPGTCPGLNLMTCMCER